MKLDEAVQAEAKQLAIANQPTAMRTTNFYLSLSLTQLAVIISIRNRDHFRKAVKPSRYLKGCLP